MSYDTPRLVCQPSQAATYHTTKCRTVKMADSVREATEHIIEWHDLEECEYCAGTFQAHKHGRAGKA